MSAMLKYILCPQKPAVEEVVEPEQAEKDQAAPVEEVQPEETPKEEQKPVEEVSS